MNGQKLYVFCKEERSPSMDQEEPEPPHIKEEQEELWTSQEGEQLPGPEEADVIKFTFNPVPVKNGQQLFVCKVEQSPSMDQEEPEPPHIKEELEELWTSQEGEQLPGLEEADIKFTLKPDPVKREYYPLFTSLQNRPTQTENSKTAPLASTSSGQNKTEADGEDCGVSEAARNVDPAGGLEPSREGQLLSSDLSKTETGQSQSGLTTLKLAVIIDESGSECIPMDSESDDENLIWQDEPDPDYESEECVQDPTPTSDEDEDDETSSSSGRLSGPLPQRRSSRLTSAAALQPQSSSDAESPVKSTQPKRKGEVFPNSEHPSKRGRGRPATQRVREEEDRWHNGEEKDERPDPIEFMPTRVPGPTIDATASWTPLSLFQLFFSASVIGTIIDNTNANAAKRLQSGLKFTWKPLTVGDFYVFLSVLLFSGLVSVHEWSNYWRKEWPYNFCFPGDTMKRDRFEAILWSLHLSKPEDDEANDGKKGTAEYDRLFKIKPLYTELTSACRSHFQPSQNIYIDERMVTRKYKKAKLTKWGYKIFVLADSHTGYTWNFRVHEGTRVTPIMDQIPFPLLGGGYTLFVDSLYSSPALFEELRRRNTGACGTIRTNRTGFPQTKRNDLPEKVKRGDLRWIRKGSLLFVKWMDTHKVTVCSTVHQALSGHTVKRKVKEGGVWQTKTVPIPDAVVDYNRSVGGVDLSDAMISYYSVHHRTMKWYKTLFFHFVDIAAVNSFLLYKELHKNGPTKPCTQKQFREKLLAEMVSFAKRSEPPPPPPPPSCMPEYYSDNASKDRKNCRRCQDSGIPKVKTPVYCRKCKVPLCLTSKRNCFRDWHNR